MNWIKLPAVATLVAALITSPATAYADCGELGQDPCAGPVPTVEQVLDLLGGLTDPDVPAASKTNIVTPGFAPDEAGTIDDHLTRMRAFGRGLLPPLFHVTDIQPAPNNFAGATVSTGGYMRQITNPRPIVLVNEGGHWLITHETAIPVLDAIWAASWK
jgi:hypothetical protein